ncbi:MAG: ABC transporter ATP-binding protein [Actinobacteria bacterium]|nr:ABC transporter ATP-binding protein [Actinomycetota bacterium]
MISTNGLTKRFGSVAAVDHVDLNVREGDIYGFLGANGSGKTTTVRMLLGLVLATSGQIDVLGERMPANARSVLPHVGALVEGPAAYVHLSARRNLSLLDASGPNSKRPDRSARVDDALEQVGLGGVGRKHVRAFSLGMRQRLGLAAALLNGPRLLVLDEPTNGLDPQGIHEIRQLLQELSRRGTTIFLSSHLLSEVEVLCTRIGVLDRGRLVLEDEIAHLRAPTGRTFVRTSDPALAVRVLDGRVAEQRHDELVVSGGDPALINAQLVSAGVRVSELAAERHSLEDIILAHTRAGSDRVGGPT